MNELPFTGERFVPGTKGEIWIEHWHRYHFASRWVAGKRVLDVACGEGYGAALLARQAAHVTGVDLSAAAIEHARGTYGGIANLELACAECTRLPLPDASIDVAVSFETLEHITAQEAFLDELARVLKPEGVLLLSSPNKLEYSERRGFSNPFHVKELYREELAAMVGARFPAIAWYAQKPSFFSVIAPEAAAGEAQVIETDEANPDRASPKLESPLYFLVAASRDRAALAALPALVSVLSDRDEWMRRDYEKVFRWMEDSVARAKALDADVAQRDRSIASLQAAVHARDAQLAVRDLAVSEKEREIERRRGWRWWLKLPLIRMGLLK
jgi:ubiquinone/menaquinone biosynthesis C-methylase UbiE